MSEAAQALTAPEFARLMTRFAPFEGRPRLAAAVSGGPDSLALCLLAGHWARAAGGALTAITVDHGLRPDSAAEARQVGRWLEARGVPHVVLRWREPPPAANVQARARAARYRLLEDWCRRRGVLHLLLGHHREDQAETLLMRLGRGSGVDGLAGMAPVSETRYVRLLRPLLEVPRARLRATLDAQGQDWIEDPSNEDLAYARVRIRKALPALAREGLTAARLADTAARLGRARAALEAATVELLAAGAVLSPAGYGVVDAERLAAAPAETGLRALARLLVTVGGGVYGPRLERLERLYGALCRHGRGGAADRGRTLAGCRILPAPRVLGAGTRLLICREPAAIAEPAALDRGPRVHWDGRYLVAAGPRCRGLNIGRLGRAGWAELVRAAPELRKTRIPGAVRPSLPAIRDRNGLVAVPHLGYLRERIEGRAVPAVRLAPHHALGGARYIDVVL